MSVLLYSLVRQNGMNVSLSKTLVTFCLAQCWLAAWLLDSALSDTGWPPPLASILFSEPVDSAHSHYVLNFDSALFLYPAHSLVSVSMLVGSAHYSPSSPYFLPNNFGRCCCDGCGGCCRGGVGALAATGDCGCECCGFTWTIGASFGTPSVVKKMITVFIMDYKWKLLL